jgi:hypothetical protein
MDVGNGGREDRGCLVRVGPHEDAVAVIFIGNEEVVVATIGWVWESACLVRVDNVFGFMDREETGVGPGLCGGWVWLVGQVFCEVDLPGLGGLDVLSPIV